MKQGDDEETEEGEETCILDFTARVRLGPSSESRRTRQIAGRLEITVDDEGAIGGELIVDEDEDPLTVHGQETGRSVTLWIGLSGDPTEGFLVAVGAGLNQLRFCSQGNAYAGLTSGPEPGDIGDWRATIVRTGGSVCPEEPNDCEAPCEDGLRQTVACGCVSIGAAVCDVECDEGQTLTDDCECVCLA